MITLGTLINDRYRIETVLGHGGFGSVYLATHVHLGRMVAIKQLYVRSSDAQQDAAVLLQFKQEAQLLQRLSHPRLPTVYDYLEWQDSPYLVMEYVKGRTIANILETEEEPLVLSKVVEWSLALCDVLQYLHGQTPPIIFRDLKPSNIMLDVAGQIKLIDFGISKLMDPTVDTQALAKGAGTPGYSAPEQYNATTDHRSDIYSLGATMYNLLTGHTPPSAIELAAGLAELTSIEEYHPKVPKELEALVERCMRIRAGERPKTVAEVAEELGYIVKLIPGGPATADPLEQGKATRHILEEKPTAPDHTGKLTGFEVPETLRVRRVGHGADGTTDRKVPLARAQEQPQPPPAKPPVALMAAGGAVVVVTALVLWRFVFAPVVAPPTPPKPSWTPHTFKDDVSPSASPGTVAMDSAQTAPGFPYRQVDAGDKVAGAHYEAVRSHIMKITDYAMQYQERGAGSTIRYDYRCKRIWEVRTEILNGSQEGTVLVAGTSEIPRGKVLAKRGAVTTWKDVTDASIHDTPFLCSAFDMALGDVQGVEVHSRPDQVVNGHKCWILEFSNQTTWAIDAKTLDFVEVRKGPPDKQMVWDMDHIRVDVGVKITP